ncbi:hypothetical protein CIB48_g4905 [Xylaria polymorpha]|nr:hypothetical protein CIB48_g4905 [Xylaria polymorpha]
MPNRCEDLVKAITEKSIQDKRTQPWKKTADTSSTTPEVEWIKINEDVNHSDSGSDSDSGSEGGANAFHKSSVDVRTNLF